MEYVVMFVIGFFIGAITLSIFSIAGDSDKVTDAYNAGYKAGSRSRYNENNTMS